MQRHRLLSSPTPCSTAALLVGLTLAAVALSACAAGDPRFAAETPAGFFAGLWHGIISFVTLIIGIFSDAVRVYEVHNVGGWYDFGFLLGATCFWGGSSSAYRRGFRRGRRSAQVEDEWRDVSEAVERKIKRKIAEWADAEPDEDWTRVEAKAERKLKRKLKQWLESEDTLDPDLRATDRAAPK